jgi:hypothetical protein
VQLGEANLELERTRDELNSRVQGMGKELVRWRAQVRGKRAKLPY